MLDQDAGFSEGAKPVQDQTRNIPLAEYTKSTAALLASYTGQSLKEQIKAFDSWAAEKQNRLTQQFEIENRGHPGVVQTEKHMVAIVDFFTNKWMTEWVATARRCHSAIRSDYSKFVSFIASTKSVLATNGDDFPAWPIASLGDALPVTCDFSASLSKLSRPDRGSADYGPIGIAAKWLLQTESRDLALIIGMIGFGLFGALSAAFIRGDSAQQQDAINYQKAIFIRGVSAAVVRDTPLLLEGSRYLLVTRPPMLTRFFSHV